MTMVLTTSSIAYPILVQQRMKTWKWAKHHSLYVGCGRHGAEEEGEEEDGGRRKNWDSIKIYIGSKRTCNL